MTKAQSEKYEICKKIIRLARVISKEDDKPHYFKCFVLVNGKRVELNTREMYRCLDDFR